MDDRHIVELYWQRSQEAVAQTQQSYGRYLHGLARRILPDVRDAEECVNDTYRDAWNAIPPHRPENLSAFLGKITRRNCLDRWRRNGAKRRGGGEIPLVLEEMEECIPGDGSVEAETERREIVRAINDFLRGLPLTERQVFLRRCWYLEPISLIASRFGFSESKTVSMLHRTRVKLRAYLEKEGFV